MTATDFPIEIGEGFAGEGPNAAHINTVLGLRDGPVGTAFATALAQPSPGHVPFLAVWSPNIPIEPATLFVNKATIADDNHGALTWGAAQAGVAAGVTEFAADELDSHLYSLLALIVAVWVNPAADDANQVFANNHAATLTALRRGSQQHASNSAVKTAISALKSGLRPNNPYFAPH